MAARPDRPGTRTYCAYDVAYRGQLPEKGGADVESAVVAIGEAQCDAARRAMCVRRASA